MIVLSEQAAQLGSKEQDALKTHNIHLQQQIQQIQAQKQSDEAAFNE